ncbi:alpha-1,3-mannosyl-glycoprotein 4-beta-N-acetylglucosaminyltransferase B isoform X3 [Paroedura picta]|uniref:alpha-1,3-mannosyl-glycoprotein 4-beta-N-acetylglucosaminyltransferase B isoform X3 n=1 Tax=Paroedura picta TaxID=143630 RepID=UPI004056246D
MRLRNGTFLTLLLGCLCALFSLSWYGAFGGHKGLFLKQLVLWTQLERYLVDLTFDSPGLPAVGTGRWQWWRCVEVTLWISAGDVVDIYQRGRYSVWPSCGSHFGSLAIATEALTTSLKMQGDVVDIYQREFLALRDRLHAAEQESLKRSKELNLVLDEIKQAISEKQALRDINRTWSSLSDETKLKLWNITNKNVLHLPTIFHHLPHLLSKENSLQPAVHVGQGRTGVSVVMGIPSVKREVHSYLTDTLNSLISELNQQEKEDSVIVVLIAETDQQYTTGVAENIKNLWRTKQNLDYCFLMMYAQSKGIYYVQLEDDIVAKPNYLSTMKNFALQQPSEEWMILEFSQLGFIGKMFKSLDLSLIVEFILMFYKDKPIDWLLDHILWVKVCNPEKDAKHCDRQKANLRIRFKPSLFQHVGTHSSLAGKIQKLKDKDFGKQALRKEHVNPPAEVSTSLKTYQHFTLEKAYMREDFFWAFTPTMGDFIRFRFFKPLRIERFFFRSGNIEHPEDKLFNTTVEVLPFDSLQSDKEALQEGRGTAFKFHRTSDGYIQIGSFSKGIAEGEVDPSFGPLEAIRLTIQTDSPVWIILSEIFLKKAD